MMRNSQHEPEGDNRRPDGVEGLAEFDLSEPETVAQVGHQLIDEHHEIGKRYPKASKAQDEAEGDVDVFFEVASLDTEFRSAQVIEDRIRWNDEALRAWVEFVTNTGLDSHDDVQEALNRLVIDSIRKIY